MDEQPTAVFNPRVWWVISCSGRNTFKDTVGARRVKSASAKVRLVPDVSNRRLKGKFGGWYHPLCLTDVGNYAVRHNPLAYYGGRCPANVVSFDRLSNDLTSDTPLFVWISPDMCHDTHDCPVPSGDDWLEATVPQIQTNAVAALVIAPKLKAHTSAVAYDHYSLLATVEDRLGVSRLGNALGANAINDVIATR